LETITVGQLKAELSRFKDDTPVEIMIGWSTQIIRVVVGDDEEGVYLEVGDGS